MRGAAAEEPGPEGGGLSPFVGMGRVIGVER